MQDVQAWLKSNRSYRVGVMLYLKHGTNNLLKRSFATEQESPYKKQRLAKELEALISKNGVKVSTKQPEKAVLEVKVSKEEETVKVNQDPKTQNPLEGAGGWPRSACRDDHELSLWSRAMILLKEIASLHSTLSTAYSDFDRREAAFTLLRKDDELDEIYLERDLYRQTKIPKAPEAIEYITDPFLMGQRIANLTRYIRREKGNMATKGVTTDRENRLAEYVKEYNYYAEKLNRPLKTC